MKALHIGPDIVRHGPDAFQHHIPQNILPDIVPALNNEVIGLEDWVATREEMEDNVDQFLALMEKYVDIPELTTTIVNEFIKQIIVYAPDKFSGKRTQKVKIVFNFLEEVEVPEISEPVIMQTTYGRRKTA